ncbi:MAG: pantoate--beta-alanine ligase, partial [Chloroflexia bacterium]|nr:pantoate--beta-alanine ligase [Chloroflexia bacterium]
LNPTQFADPDDLERYPRDLDRDVALAVEAGADLVYAPAVEAIYPPGFATSVHVAGLTDRWEGAARPGHFEGVATVVAVLLNQVRPARSYFGEKDFQQLVVIRRLHADLALPGEIVGCRTVREADGLALSSRNARLSAAERRRAAVLWRALFGMRTAVDEGVTEIDVLLAGGEKAVLAEPGVRLDYLAIVDPATLDPLDRLVPGARAIIAATVGGTRLIDNVTIGDRG